MKDIFILIATNKETFKDFRQWLFIKLNKNTSIFASIGKQPNNIKLPYLLEYLENKEVPLLDAHIYYYWKHSLQELTWHGLSMYVVIEEFKRLETKETINYIPF